MTIAPWTGIPSGSAGDESKRVELPPYLQTICDADNWAKDLEQFVNIRRGRPIELSLRSIQEQLPWTIPYSPAFLAADLPHKDLEHALIHVVKACGRIAALCDNADHGRNFTMERGELPERLADLVMCAMRMANTAPSGPIDLQRAVESRIEAKNGVKLVR